MISRRQFVGSVPAVLGGASVLSACSQASDPEGYEAVAANTRRTGPLTGMEGQALTHRLVRCATLAPSSRNTQCWKFAAEDKASTMRPNPTRRCPAVDSDDHHLFVTLGCATENLFQAAPDHGLVAMPNFDAASDNVRVLLLTDRPAIERPLEHVFQGNTAQMADPAFVQELKFWIRFNGTDAARLRDGLLSVSSGNPSIPAWLGDLALGWFFTTKGENDKIARQVRNSAGIAVFVGEAVEEAHWVEVGQAYERFALQATALGIRNAFLKQPVKSPLCARHSPPHSASQPSSRTSWCALAAGRRCRSRCAGRSSR